MGRAWRARQTFEEQLVPLFLLGMAAVLVYYDIRPTAMTFLLTFWYAWIFQRTRNRKIKIMSFGLVCMFVFISVVDALSYQLLPGGAGIRRTPIGLIGGGGISYTEPSPLEQAVWQAALPMLVVMGMYIGWVYDGWKIFPNTGAIAVFLLTIVNVWGYALGFGRIIGVLDTVGPLSVFWDPIISRLESAWFLGGMSTLAKLVIAELVLAFMFNFIILLTAALVEVWS